MRQALIQCKRGFPSKSCPQPITIQHNVFSVPLVWSNWVTRRVASLNYSTVVANYLCDFLCEFQVGGGVAGGDVEDFSDSFLFEDSYICINMVIHEHVV